MIDHDEDRSGTAGVLREQGDEVERILEALDSAEERPERAELAGELIKATSVLVDIEERVLIDVLAQNDHDEEAIRLRAEIEGVRQAMEPVYEASHRSMPIEVHQSDAEGFERDLAELHERVRAYLELERDELDELEEDLDPSERTEIEATLEQERDGAIPVPRPAHSGIGRRLHRLMARLDIPDTATPYRPVSKPEP